MVASRYFFLRHLQASNLESALDALMLITNIRAADSTRSYMKMVTQGRDLFTHTWSIALEMQFYLVFPFIFTIYKLFDSFMAYLFLITIGCKPSTRYRLCLSKYQKIGSYTF
ncbi:hypothetical protein KIN20_029681 [Parelaphostrongylus tenuis]|uniref:Uncharacterized protein n=1 Tax=Parelaphostrongylus tenuis TaxID=148309 RepID=A0AAD5R3M1_PARTN|nr:hypothetical protein KIN20_029681 [Parelaphostrongylus tenuis]